MRPIFKFQIPMLVAPSQARSLRAWLYPDCCPLCFISLGAARTGLCAACRAHLVRNTYACDYCASNIGKERQQILSTCAPCLRQPPLYRAVVPFLYRSPLAELLWQFKYRSRYYHGSALGSLLAHELQSAEVILPDALMPMPMACGRLAERGYNHSQVLAKVLGARLGLPVLRGVAQRVLDTRPQAELSARSRARNVRGAFRVVDESKLAGLRVAIVDDVLTTGSSIVELAQCLLAAGAAEVRAFALLRADDIRASV